MKTAQKRNNTQFFIRVASLVALLLASTALHAAETAAMTEEQKTFYAIGSSVSHSLSVFEKLA